MKVGVIVGFLLVVVGLGVFTYRSIYRRKKRRRSSSDLTMQGAWDYWMKNKNPLSGEDRQIVELAEERLSESAIESIRRELLELEEKSNTAEDPLVALRTAIMDAVDTSLLNREIGNLDDEAKENVQGKLGKLYTDEVFLWGYVAKSFMCRILRWYSSIKYGDAAENDWFASYQAVADQRAKKIVEMIRHWEGDENGANGIHTLVSRADEEQAMGQVRQKFLQSPVTAPGRKAGGTGAKRKSGDWRC